MAYAKAMMEAGKIPEIKGGRGGATAKDTNVVTVGKRGSVIISKGYGRRSWYCSWG